MKDIKVGEKENYEQKTLLMLVLDDSGSMSGDPIKELNRGVEQFLEEIRSDARMRNSLEISAIRFGTDIDVVQEPALVNSVTIPKLDGSSGATSLNGAIREAIAIVERRKQEYDAKGISRNCPWIVTITDGAPTDGSVDALSKRIETDTKNGKYVHFPIGVDGADMATLAKLAGYIGNDKSGPARMQHAKFIEFFEWLSRSMEVIVNSKPNDKVSLPTPTWMDGFTVS